MMIIKNKQRIQKRLGISFPILREFCQQHKITELSVFGSMPEYPK
jgi:predicted nucleotidyltransferase